MKMNNLSKNIIKSLSLKDTNSLISSLKETLSKNPYDFFAINLTQLESFIKNKTYQLLQKNKKDLQQHLINIILDLQLSIIFYAIALDQAVHTRYLATIKRLSEIVNKIPEASAVSLQITLRIVEALIAAFSEEKTYLSKKDLELYLILKKIEKLLYLSENNNENLIIKNINKIIIEFQNINA
jgi:hypothetical protein